MDVYALFGDGTASKLCMEFFVPVSGDPRAVQSFAISSVAADVIRSAEKALNSAYSILSVHEKNLKRNYGISLKKQYRISYEFKGIPHNKPVMGASATLAFLLKFCYGVLGIRRDYAVAATGELDIGGKDAKVIRVADINEKIEAGIGVLNSGDRVYYPKDNEKEIREDLLSKAKERGLILCGVTTAEEVIKKEFPKIAGGNLDIKKILATILIVAVVYISGGIYLQSYSRGHYVFLGIANKLEYLYPWVKFYLQLGFDKKKTSQVIKKTFLRDLVNLLVKKDFILKAYAYSESEYFRGKPYEVKLCFKKCRIVRSRTERNLDNICGRGKDDSSLDSTYKKAALDLWRKLLVIISGPKRPMRKE